MILILPDVSENIFVLTAIVIDSYETLVYPPPLKKLLCVNGKGRSLFGTLTGDERAKVTMIVNSLTMKTRLAMKPSFYCHVHSI